MKRSKYRIYPVFDSVKDLKLAQLYSNGLQCKNFISYVSTNPDLPRKIALAKKFLKMHVIENSVLFKSQVNFRFILFDFITDR